MLHSMIEITHEQFENEYEEYLTKIEKRRAVSDQTT